MFSIYVYLNAEMKQFASGGTSVFKQHYEKKVHELEIEKRALQKVIEELRRNFSNICSYSDDSAQRLKEEYLQNLNVLEAQSQLWMETRQVPLKLYLRLSPKHPEGCRFKGQFLKDDQIGSRSGPRW